MNSNSTSYRAEWVVPIDGPPIENGSVRIEDGLIQSVEKSKGPLNEETDLGSVVLMPGLVNAHTHLEFSDLTTPLGQPGMDFTDWIRLVVHRRMRFSQIEGSVQAKTLAIEKGLTESIAAGVVLLGEISTQPLCVQAYCKPSVETVTFIESLGRDESQLETNLSIIEDSIRLLRNRCLQVGISPHAPYSVGNRLFDRLLDIANVANIPVAMHLAESKEELVFMKEGSGPFVPLLKTLNAWWPSTYVTPMRPMDYLKKLAELPISLLIHGNFLDEAELDFVAVYRDRMTPVFCPRTHRFFQHDRYPLLSMCQRGIDVAVGTDSRASNPDLCLLSELKAIHQSFPDLSPETIVRMGTINGAAALGMQDSYGSLTPGKKAAFCVIKCDRQTPIVDPYLAVLNGTASSIKNTPE